MDLDTSTHTVLLLHDGELGDLPPLLDTIGASFAERLGGIPSADVARPWDIVIATPAKLVDLPSDFVAGDRVCIAEGDSRSLRTILERVNVRFVIVRPVHAVALEQILSQALYSGRENRRSIRRAVGETVRFRSGWRAERGILADLSEAGCRLLTPHGLAPGKGVTVYVPLRAGSRKALSVRGTVVRASLTDGLREERNSIHIQFDELSNKLAIPLSEIVERLKEGPAVLPTCNDGSAAEGRPTTAESARRGPSAVPVANSGEAVERSDEPPLGTTGGGSELRSDPRLVYSARIIALGEAGARVLTAEDISSGGLRAGPHPDAAIGDELQVAIPMPGDKEPLVVKARVVRNQDGLTLAFHELPPESYERLHRQLEKLPEVESSFTKDDEPARIIVPEIP